MSAATADPRTKLDELLADDVAAVNEILVRDYDGTTFWIGLADLAAALRGAP